MTSIAGQLGQNPNTEVLEEPADLNAALRERKRDLVIGLRLLAKHGLDDGIAGHIAVRDIEEPDYLWVNPLAKRFSIVGIQDLLLVDSVGEIRSGAGRVNRAAFAIHAAVHARRSDVIASVHSHSPYGKAWSMLGQLLSPLSQDSCAFYQDHAVHHDFSGLVLDAEEGFTISDSLGQNKAVILQNHGLLTVGGSVGAAVWWFLAMEKACECEIHARSVRSPIVLSSEVAKVTREQIGTEYTGRFIFSALRAEYLAEHGTVEPGR